MFRWLCILTVLTGFIVYPINLLAQAIGLENAVSAWLFDEGSGTITANAVQGAPEGNLVGGPAWVEGLPGKALEFDGVDDAVEVGINPLKGAHALTVQAYIKPMSVPDFESAKIFNIGLESATQGKDRFMLDILPYGDGWVLSHFMSIEGNRSDAEEVVLESGPVHTFGEWYHVAMVFDSTSPNTVKIKQYINHSLELEWEYTITVLNEGQIFIGERYEIKSSTGRRNYFHGVIDNVILHKRALTPEEFMPAPGDVGVTKDHSLDFPTTFALYQNHPNPFNPVTKIHYDIPQGMRTHVKLEVFNLLGQRISTLTNKIQQTGSYSVCWNGKRSDGSKAPSGIYWYRLTAEQNTLTKRMVLVH